MFVVTCGVHPGEKPANHMLCASSSFCAARRTTREWSAWCGSHWSRLSRVPMLNPDGRLPRPLPQRRLREEGLNRCYDAPDPRAHPTIAATWAMLMRHAEKNELGFYASTCTDTSINAGCFRVWQRLGTRRRRNRTRGRVSSRSTTRTSTWDSVTSRRRTCPRGIRTETRKRRRTRGVVSCRGLHHLYTVEANYNSSRLLGATPPASGDDGRASPPSKGVHPIKYTPEIFNGVGRSLLIAALDLRGANPWSGCERANCLSLKRICGRSGQRRGGALGAAKTETFEVAVSKRWGTARNSLLGQKLALR